jgi:hypothetical protein
MYFMNKIILNLHLLMLKVPYKRVNKFLRVIFEYDILIHYNTVRFYVLLILEAIIHTTAYI